MKNKRKTNQIFVNENDSEHEFRFDVCRIIEELNKLPFDFYISGGIICQFFFKEHSRYVNDIDIVTKNDLKEVESIFRKHFDVIEFIINSFSDPYYVERFMCLIEIDGKIIQIDGMRLDFFDEIKPEIYKINETSFKGVPIDYLAATKILAVTCKVERPFKHLVDIYTVSRLKPSCIDKQEVKKNMVIFNDCENKTRKIFNKQETDLSFYIKDDKTFSGSIILATLQAGYNVSKETMVEEVNKWLRTF